MYTNSEAEVLRVPTTFHPAAPFISEMFTVPPLTDSTYTTCPAEPTKLTPIAPARGSEPVAKPAA